MLQAEPNRKSSALTFGTMIHESLARYYVPGRKRGENPEATFRELYDEHEEEFVQWDEDGNRVEALTLGTEMMKGYVEKYGADKNIEIISPEMPFELPLYDETGEVYAIFVGQIDALGRFRDTKKIFVLEHKTAKTVETVRINSGYGEQGMSYSWAANRFLKEQGVLKKSESVDMVLFNMLRKGVPDGRPVNAQGLRLNKPSKDALKAVCEDLGIATSGTVAVLSDRIRDAGEDPAQFGEPSKIQPPPLFVRQEFPVGPDQLQKFEERLMLETTEIVEARAGKVPIYKSPTKDCSWDCPFRDVCEVHEMDGDWKAMFNLEFSKWDPYESHQLESEKAES